jgi:hypothetical protein
VELPPPGGKGRALALRFLTVRGGCASQQRAAGDEPLPYDVPA